MWCDAGSLALDGRDAPRSLTLQVRRVGVWGVPPGFPLPCHLQGPGSPPGWRPASLPRSSNPRAPAALSPKQPVCMRGQDRSEEELGGACPQSQRPGCGAERLHSCGHEDARPRDVPGKAALNAREAETHQLPGSDVGTKGRGLQASPQPHHPEWSSCRVRLCPLGCCRVKPPRWAGKPTGSLGAPPGPCRLCRVGAQGRGDLSPPLRHFPTSWPPEFLP